MEHKGLKILVTSEDAGTHLAVSPDGFRIVFFQGHPEYDDVSLLKEYKREVTRFYLGERDDYPPFPENYFDTTCKQILTDYKEQILTAKDKGIAPDDFPEAQIITHIDNTWRDTAKAVFNNWLGKIYQITNKDRRLPFMDGIDPKNPLGL